MRRHLADPSHLIVVSYAVFAVADPSPSRLQVRPASRLQVRPASRLQAFASLGYRKPVSVEKLTPASCGFVSYLKLVVS